MAATSPSRCRIVGLRAGGPVVSPLLESLHRRIFAGEVFVASRWSGLVTRGGLSGIVTVMDVESLALFARNDLTRSGLRDAAERRGLSVIELNSDPRCVLRAAHAGVALRAPGGMVAQAQGLGADVQLFGPTAEWFVSLGSDITGRLWHEMTAAAVRELLAAGPAFVKLADAKRRDLPARRYVDGAAFDRVIGAVSGGEQIRLLATAGWLDIDSEYRVFTHGRRVLTTSPYRVQDEPWSALLHTHRASFHTQAGDHAAEILSGLADADVPPAAVIDVARLANGRLVVLEANQSWGSGLYGCDPHAALVAVLVANTSQHPRWLWRPDPWALPPDAGTHAFDFAMEARQTARGLEVTTRRPVDRKE